MIFTIYFPEYSPEEKLQEDNDCEFERASRFIESHPTLLSDIQHDSSLYLQSVISHDVDTGVPIGVTAESASSSDLLYKGARITVEESVYATISFCQSEHISGSGLGRLLGLIEIHCPENNKLLKTDHMFFKKLESVDTPFEVTHYCSRCFKFRQSSKDLCDTCTDPKRKVDYFVKPPLKSQFDKKFSRKEFVESLRHKKNRTKQKEENYEDIYDGEVYKDAEKIYLKNEYGLTLMWYTDGIALYECSTFSLWPFFFVICELPIHERFKPENIIMGGLWGSHEKPHPNIFLQAVTSELIELRNGTEFSVHGLDVKVPICICLLCGTADGPAKAAFLNLKTHMGFFSCPKCLIEGQKDLDSEDVMVFPHQEVLIPRTEENYQEHLDKAQELKRKKKTTKDPTSFMGVKGPTLLTHMLPFCPFRTTGIDSLHCIYLGVMKNLLTLLFDSKFKEKPFSLFSKTKEVNDVIQAIQLPHFVQREILPVDKIAFMKGSVLRNFFFHFMLPVFYKIMKDEYFDNIVDLVKGVSLLNTDSVSKNDIALSDQHLTAFCKNFQRLYGLRRMTFNIHLLRHLPKCVEELGPLQIVSCFRLEEINGKLANLAHGTRHAGLQVASGLSLVSELARKVRKLPDGIAKSYCEFLMYKWKRLNIREKICDDIFVIGSFDDSSPYSEEIDEMLSQLYTDLFNAQIFTRLYKSNLMYVASSYGKGSRDSSFVKFSQGNESCFGEVLCFIKVSKPATYEPDVLAYIKRFTVSPFSDDHDINFMHRFVPSDGNVVVVPVSDLQTVCFKSVAKFLYVSELLNRFELE